MDQVKKMVDSGVSLATAIKEALGQSMTSWADEYGLSRQITSEVLNSERAPRPDVCRALEQHLGGEAFEWAQLLWKAAKPKREAFATADAA